MTKKEILNLSEKDAFILGKDHFKDGFDISYDPYRNMDFVNDKKIGKLRNAYINGWMSESRKAG